MRKVIVQSYNERWPSMFDEEAEKLKHIFGEEIVSIHHIGSTSVPGLKAKPIIDIMPVVKDINKIDQYNNEMISIGYTPKGENGISQRRYFQKGGDNRTHHVHIYQSGCHDIIRHLAFRDYLRTHPQVKEQYGEMKQRLADRYFHDNPSYRTGKERFVQEVEKKALEWYEAVGFRYY